MNSTSSETKHEVTPKEGDMRVWWARNFTSDPNGTRYYPVDSIETAKALILKMSEDDANNPLVKENSFGLEVYMNEDWVEWTDADSLDILEQFT